ncbi:uncharacterized protein LOC133182155 [Saccostrea echinata]|uniref:uncharacterized protein LOC133182155 n=1 Tax=Saccostrea echinata TaxID=191078 RepID=UPI002A7EC6B9|nr:uncharacterized protein LOC133182155 [Saccostrea echinata]
MDLFSLAIVLFTALDTAIGLECSKCTHVVIKDVPSFLQNIVIPKSPQCASTPPGQTANGVSLVQCPSNPTSGQVYKCGTYTGTIIAQIDLTIFKTSVDADIVYRDCVLMDPAVPTSCVPQNNIPADNAVLKTVLSSLADINAVNFVGTRCVVDERSMSSLRSASNANHLSDAKIVLYTFILVISKYSYYP